MTRWKKEYCRRLAVNRRVGAYLFAAREGELLRIQESSRRSASRSLSDDDWLQLMTMHPAGGEDESWTR